MWRGLGFDAVFRPFPIGAEIETQHLVAQAPIVNPEECRSLAEVAFSTAQRLADQSLLEKVHHSSHQFLHAHFPCNFGDLEVFFAIFHFRDLLVVHET